MTDPLDVLQKLRGGVLPVQGEQRERERRARIAGRVLELSRELRGRRERRRRFGLGVAVAALVSACAFGLFLQLREPSSPELVGVGELRLVSGHASLRQGAGLAPLEYGQLALSGDSLLVTRADDGAELRLSSDTAVNVAPSSEVGIARRQPTLDGFEERVRLRSGSVALRVPKLGSHGKVSVETRDTLVEVHGTQFSVRVVERPPLDSFTEVAVREGRVLVRSGEQSRFLGAGDRWSSREDAPPFPGAATAPPPSAATEPAAKREPAPESPPPRTLRAHRKAHPPERSVSPSELAAQNRLLEAAELAQRSGMTSLALERLDTLIARYPDAELAHNARVERFRALRFAGRNGEAVAAARAYLERHPDGFARQEAERLIAELSAPASHDE
jgi:FecR protein